MHIYFLSLFFFWVKFHQNKARLASKFFIQTVQHKQFLKQIITMICCDRQSYQTPLLNQLWMNKIFQRLLIPSNSKRFSLQYSILAFVNENCLTMFFLLWYCLMLKSFRDSLGWKTTKHERNCILRKDLTLFLGLLWNNLVFQSLEYYLPLTYLITACLWPVS